MRIRSVLCAAGVGALLLASLDFAQAAEKAAKPDATLHISAKALAAGAGYSWGGGQLAYGGKKYEVTIDGLTVGAVSVTSITASGKVYNLKKLEDFDGTYAAVKAGATVGGGGSVSALKNQNGVRINLRATSRGLKLTAGAEGVTLAIKK
jgi:hypothetical protein